MRMLFQDVSTIPKRSHSAALHGAGGSLVALVVRAQKDDRGFVESVYFETQLWIIEPLFGRPSDEIGTFT